MEYTAILAVLGLAALIFVAWLAYKVVKGAVNGIRDEFRPEARLKNEERTIEYRETTRREYYEPPYARDRDEREPARRYERDDDLPGADGNYRNRDRRREGARGGKY